MRPLSEILSRINQGTSVVMTSQEVCDLVDSGKTEELKGVDVVTTATRAVMSGTFAVLSFPVAKPHKFLRARTAFINGVPAQVGPCPNENLGVLDVVVFGTAHSRDDPEYGGGHLFRDLVERKPVFVDAKTDKGKHITAEVGLDEMPFARLFGSRHAFKNYSTFVNPSNEPLMTIFHARGFEPRCGGATFSGCGQINPIKNDPLLETIGVGTRVLLNGGEGFVMGIGTRSCSDRPNLAAFGDMHLMDPEYMGGFLTSAGPECICSWAVPIPVTTNTILSEIARLDRDICLPIMDVVTRTPLGMADYGDVWDGVDLAVEFDSENCKGCARCKVEQTCPMKAVSFHTQAERDESICFHCGLCVSECPSGAFKCNLGQIKACDKAVPVVLRQSDRLRALKLAEELKRQVLEGTFKITQPVERICS
jgi:putative methanogenesis marker 16 metalloprotein